ncbi:MAG: methyltransferase, partial [Planctomycetota bacterium]
MSTQIQSSGTHSGQSGQWTEDGGKLLSQPFVNFIARRRIAISLVGFLGLMSYNLFVKGTIPLNPFDVTDFRTLVALALLAAGLGIRSWAAGTLNKSREVTQHGPYALVRNPLYVGSFLMMFSFCILLRDFASFLFVAGPICFVYWLQVQFEEKRLLFLFPNDWPDYVRSVPRFVP